MIIVRLIGGIGNQMFQYAVGRALSCKNKDELKLDVSCFVYERFRKYDLGALNISENFATAEEATELKFGKPALLRKLKRKISGDARKPAPSYVKEEHFYYDPRILQLKGNLYLEGYWQSEKYFADIGDIIRNDFSFKECSAGRNLEIAQLIEKSESVAVHVRRGDYITDKAAIEILGACSSQYYNAAMDMMIEDISNPHFFIFSDDIAWAKHNLSAAPDISFVSNEAGSNEYDDLRLMSLCKHIIIANSSFSWWGAWLNRNPGKKVIAPARWFEAPDYDTRDLCPESWQRIDIK